LYLIVKFARIARRVHAIQHERWHAELERDARAGKFDLLIAGAQDDRKASR
jgi:hypothetical protein